MIELTVSTFWMSLAGQMGLVVITFALALVLGVPLGFLCYRSARVKLPLMRLVALLQKLPALALFGLFVAVGGKTGSLTALWLALIYTLLPIIFGSEKGFRKIDRPAIDAALGMGLSYRETFFNIMLPLASGQIMRGLRKAAVDAVGMVTMATLGGGGLGWLILQGILKKDPVMIVAGAVPACVLALLADRGVFALEKVIVPAALRREEKQRLFIEK